MGLGFMMLVGGCVDRTLPDTGNLPPLGTMTEVRVLPLVTVSEPGLRETFVAMGVYSSGRSQLVPPAVPVTWSSSDETVATVDSTGTVKALKKGSAFITATAGGFSAKGQINVGPSLVSVQLSPLSQEGIVDVSSAYQLIALYDDHSKKDVTAATTWSTYDPSVAVVDGPGSYTGIGPGTTAVIAAYRGLASLVPATLTITAQPLTNLTVSPAAVTLAIGTIAPLTATATYSPDESDVDASKWETSDEKIATVDADGVVTAVKAGTATITATYKLGGVTKTATSVVTVTAAKIKSIAVSPADAYTRPVGASAGFNALATLDDDSTQDVTLSASWSIVQPKDADDKDHPVASGRVLMANGIYSVSALAAYTSPATIVAELGDVTSDVEGAAANGSLLVADAPAPTISITSSSANVAVGSTATLTASALYTYTDTALGTFTRNVSSLMVWEVSDATVGEVDNGGFPYYGLFTALKTGSVNVTGYYRLESVGTVTITVP